MLCGCRPWKCTADSGNYTMPRFFIAGILLSAVSLWGQLIPAGKAVPRTAQLPVVFLNGCETDCDSASFKGTFGIADQVLQANGQVSLFFNYCTVPSQPSIEDMGTAFGAFLSGLRYEDGQPVDLVDSVAYRMGGLIMRSYLSGKGSAGGPFDPPAVTHVRKIVSLRRRTSAQVSLWDCRSPMRNSTN
jgi:hypothetical protein